MTKKEKINKIEKLQELLLNASYIVDELSASGVKLRILVGQETKVEKVMHENSSAGAVLQVTEAIEYNTIYKLEDGTKST